MKWSWKIGELAGIGVYVHATFPLLLVWVAVTHWIEARTALAVVEGVSFILAIFFCVVLHELGHALTAKRYGIKTRDITLLPIGGLARLERMPEKPIEELWVALAGPAVNVVIAAALYAWLKLTSAWEPIESLSITGGSFLERLAVVNGSLVLFNLLPAFPMDGGRVLRAILATWMDYTRATQIAAGVGQAMAFLFGFLGFTQNQPFLLLIALFVWLGASQEAAMVQMKAALGGIPVRRAMLTDFRAVAPPDSLGDVVRLIIAGSQQDFPVVDDGRILGILTRNDLITGLSKGGEGVPVSQVMQRTFLEADPAEMLEGAFQRLQGCECRTMAVTRGGRLVGLLTTENLGEFLLIQNALGAARTRAAAKPA